MSTLPSNANADATNLGPRSSAAWSRADVIRWWELRRIPYNLVLLVIGAVALYGGLWVLSGKRPELSMDAWPIAIPCFIYGFIANIFYTLGWVVELWAARPTPPQHAAAPCSPFAQASRFPACSPRFRFGSPC